ncbi:DNA-binding YbaB/EbfC family protein [Micromonospora luteifusca]|uniref:DNA-binding YbaB/EbfC family protein n=1 Tax=Micromonospora luteifusca TaxID=709860 RepID=A0ABS2LP96_9ACTN|nr:YbaB/EbfC family nucleoid-associated protein [Micromonospora luteifusca]MBM7489484.1 DNA-binding YbaB/EbfC family protein [Micromonospora luteifusca]
MQPQQEPFGLEAFAQQTREMQERMQHVQDRLLAAEATGTAGDGLVSITLTARGEVRQVFVDPSLADPARLGTLEELLAEAFTRANEAMRRLTDDGIRPLMQDLAWLTDRLPN